MMNTNISPVTAVALSVEPFHERMRQFTELQSAQIELSNKIQRLMRALKTAQNSDRDELVWVPGGLENPVDPGTYGQTWDEHRKRQQRIWQRVKMMAAGLPGNARSGVERHLRDIGMIARSEVELKCSLLQVQLRAMSAAVKHLAADMGKIMDKAGIRGAQPSLA